MDIAAFKLERFFAEHEFRARHLLSASDCESLALHELLALADPETLSLWERLSLGYTESQGHPLLRDEVARQHRQIAPDEVLIAAPEEAIFIAMNALLAPGDEVVVTWPAYQSLHAIATALGCRVVHWPLTVRDGAWRLDVDQLNGLITAKTRLIVINFPHNPTGYLPARADLDAIVAIAAQNDLALFSDEMYRLLEYDPAERLPSVCDLYERGVTLSGLSKAFGLPGLRIGWLATRDQELLARCAGLKDYTTICYWRPARSWASSRCVRLGGHRRPQPGHRAQQPGVGRPFFRSAFGPLRLAAPASRVGGVSAHARSIASGTTLSGTAGSAQRHACIRRDVRIRGQPFPAGAGPPKFPGGAGNAGGTFGVGAKHSQPEVHGSRFKVVEST